MSRGVPADQGPIYDFVNARIRETGERPQYVEIAAEFDISIPTVSKIMVTGELAGHIPPRPEKEPKPESQRRDRYSVEQPEVLGYLAEHFDEHGWMPSQREIADRFGWPLSKASRVLHYLNASGLIHMGKDPRQIRITGTDLKSPEHQLKERT